MRRDAGGALLPADQPLRQPRGGQGTDGVHRQRRGEELRGVVDRKTKGDVQMVGGDILEVLVTDRLRQRGQRLYRLTTGGRGGRQAAEVPPRRREPLVRGEVTHQGQDGVVGAVVGADEVLHVRSE